MKDNRTNRNFITIKNRLRTGVISFYGWEKTNEVLDDQRLEKLVNAVKRALLKEYKLKLPKCKVLKKYAINDFVKDITTYEVRLSLK